MKLFRVAPTFLFLMLFTVLFNLQKHYLPLFLAAALHELGHAAVICLLGSEIQQIRIIPGGLDIQYQEKHCSYGGDLLIAAAGPAANLLGAMAASVFGAHADYFVGLSLILCIFNLLPIYPLDGGSILHTIMAYFSPVHGEEGFFLLSGTLSMLLFAAACGACFYNLRALWAVLIFGYILRQQKLHMLYREAI